MNNIIKIFSFLMLGMALSFTSCKSDSKTTTSIENVPAPKQRKVPSFKADSAYQFVVDQLAFGVRYPGSEGQKKMIDYITTKMKGYGAKVYTQDFKVNFLGLKDQPATNIIASFNPEISKRVLLCAHWDSRI